MKNPRAFWQYYQDVNLYTILFSLIFGIIYGLQWGLIIFGTVGTLIGFLGFQQFKKKEYFLYSNLGYSKRNLMLRVGILNLVITFLVLFILFLCTV